MRVKVIGIAIAALVGASFGSTAQPAPQTLYACVNSASGIPKFVSAGTQCTGTDVLVQWNVQGPKGDKGDKGDTGDTGAPGATGPSDLYVNGLPNANLAPKATVATLDLPLGDYLLAFTSTVANFSLIVGVAVDCEMFAKTPAGDAFLSQTTVSLDAGGVGVMAMQFPISFAAATTVRVDCRGQDNSFTGASVLNALTALKVGAIHNQ